MDIAAHIDMANQLLPVVVKAGKAVIQIRKNGLRPRFKGDASPVTAADVACERIIKSALSNLYPAIPMIGEESFSPIRVQTPGPSCFVVDPIDGTREYIDGRDDFTINVALVADDFPAMGIIYAPASGRLFFAAGGQAFECDAHMGYQSLRRIRGETVAIRTEPIVLASRSHCDDRTRTLIDDLQPGLVRKLGSSLKLALIATGEADIYPQLAPTMTWDVAAGQALVEAVGGLMLRPDGSRLSHSMAEGWRNSGFIAARTPAFAERTLAFIAAR
ncbi:MAG: 3'(2'),5'-bisphosphate nucleotidase CysQ [Phyllobacterium sp.]|uniref:3'(2'),5'-bisphosphate nucleotidase CysQ family protein n=1 Tax=Phyllobacterium sp. TaxID=1871046 RepID=UPI0030F0EB84